MGGNPPWQPREGEDETIRTQYLAKFGESCSRQCYVCFSFYESRGILVRNPIESSNSDENQPYFEYTPKRLLEFEVVTA